jgi:hypothetical protein
MIEDKQGYPIVNFRLPKDKKEYELYNKIAEEFYKNGQIKANSIGTFARFCMRVVSGQYLENWRQGVVDTLESKQNGGPGQSR